MFKALKIKIDNLKSNFLNLKYIKKSIKFYNILKTKIDNLKSNSLNLKYIKKSIKFYNILKDLAIKYKLITPKKEIEKKQFEKRFKKDTLLSLFIMIIMYFISLFGMFFINPFLLFFLFLGPIGIIILFVIHLSMFLIFIESY